MISTIAIKVKITWIASLILEFLEGTLNVRLKITLNSKIHKQHISRRPEYICGILGMCEFG